MKKLVNGFKKIFLMLGTFCISIYSKVFAVDIAADQILYGVPLEPDLYGVPRPNEIPMIWKVARGLIIPIAFIIGVIIYFKKSSSSTLRKVITILIALAIVVLTCLGINYFITNLI